MCRVGSGGAGRNLISVHNVSLHSFPDPRVAEQLFPVFRSVWSRLKINFLVVLFHFRKSLHELMYYDAVCCVLCRNIKEPEQAQSHEVSNLIIMVQLQASLYPQNLVSCV